MERFDHVTIGTVPQSISRTLNTVIPEMREEGKAELNIAQVSYNHAVAMANFAESRLIMAFNAQVARGIEGLADADAWTNLSAIAKHALGEAHKCCVRNEDRLHLEMADHFQLECDFLKTSTSEFRAFAKRLLVLADAFDLKEATRPIPYTVSQGGRAVGLG